MKQSFAADEKAKLRQFRKLASDLHSYVVEYDGFPFRANLSRPGESRLIPRDTIITMAMHVRPAYMEREETHFHRIRHILGERRDDLHDDLKLLKESWNRVFAPTMIFSSGNQTYRTKRILDTYFNGKLFHRMSHLALDVERIDKFGDATWMNFQIAIFNLAICILALDCVVAHALGETPLDPPPRRKDHFNMPEELDRGRGDN